MKTKISSCFRLVVKFKDSTLPFMPKESELHHFFLQDHILPWRQLIESVPGITINSLFRSVSPDNIAALINKARESDPFYQPPDFFSYYSISWNSPANTVEILQRLVKWKNVDLAYVQHGSILPPAVKGKDPSVFHQVYLNAAPHGINARYAWMHKGGDGTGNIQFIDVEQGWIPNHESIVLRSLTNSGINCSQYSDHGTAVLGIIMMRTNKSGGIGITPNVKGGIISQWRPDGRINTADAIMAAIEHLRSGDILLVEAQTSDTDPGHKLWPVEIEDAVYHTIRLATALGITVIEAAGNGSNLLLNGNDLDGFQLNGKNILNPGSRDYRDSGAIIVAAATEKAPHFRRENSNYGGRINCFACGENVLTAGNYPLSSQSEENTYTYSFNGTSSASAIIAGAAIAIQSISDANNCIRLNPKQMRDILNSDEYNTVSANGRHKDKIGVMPDLKKIITEALKIRPGPIPKKRQRRLTVMGG